MVKPRRRIEEGGRKREDRGKKERERKSVGKERGGEKLKKPKGAKAIQ